MRLLSVAVLSVMLAAASPSLPQQHEKPANPKSADTQSKDSDATAENAKPVEQRVAASNEQSDKRPPFWDIYWPTLGLVILGALGTVIAIRTLRDLKRQTQAAVDAACAAKTNAKAIIDSERAWIVPELRPASRQGKDGRWYSEEGVPYSMEDVLKGKHLLYSLRVTNIGRTPAHILSFQISYTCLAEGVTDLPPTAGGDLTEFREFNHLLIGGSAIEILSPIDVGDKMTDSWQEIKELKKTAVFHGWVKYRHIFSPTEECQSDYCYVFTVSENRLSSVGHHTHYR